MKRFAWGLAALLCLPLFIQCGGGSGSSQASSPADSYESITSFDWRMMEGTTIRVLLNQHSYQERLESRIADFEALTGITVEHSVIPEENYFDRLTTLLNSRTGEPDVFMTGAYQVWDYAPAGYMEPLDSWLNDSRFTSPDYDFADFYDGIISSLQWSLRPGEPTGTGSQWALPLGFEGYVLVYNGDYFAANNLEAPQSLDEMLEIAANAQGFNGSGSYGIGLRGTRNWATIHPGYMSTYATWGAQDLAIENGRLVSRVNSPEAVAMTDYWVRLVRAGGSPTWASSTWYQAATDLGAGMSAMCYDADITAFFQNEPGASAMAGRLVFAPAPLPEGKTEADRKSNLWIWALSMNAASRNKLAAWIFMQYFTSKDYLTVAATPNTPRESVFNSPEYRAVIDDSVARGYASTFEQMIDGMSLQFTPNPYFTEIATEWAATLQQLVAGGTYSSTQEGMDALKRTMDNILSDVELE